MLVLYPLVLAGALMIAHRNRENLIRGAGAGPRWFAAWTAAGAVLAFSFISGLSIGLLLLPVAAVVLFFVAPRSRLTRETFGLLAGAGLVLLCVGAATAAPFWIASGAACSAASALGYLAPRRQVL